MRFLTKLGTLVAGLCLGYILSGVMGLILSRGDATKALVVAAVVVVVCSVASKIFSRPGKKSYK